jgi:predicted negative regulator of RcsB-dependent stress response
VGTTKLTRKEILGEDPIYEAMVASIEQARTHGKTIALVAGSALLVALGIYLGLGFLERRDLEAQKVLTRGMDFFHASVDASALDDPYGKGSDPLFRNEESRYRAAAREFGSVVERHGSSKLGVIARYYLGLCQMQLGQKTDAIKSLEVVRDNPKERTVAYLAKKVLSKVYVDNGNPKAAQEVLEGMIKDPQCDLPKEELKLQLARSFLAQGKRDDALRTLREARGDAARSGLQNLISQELSRLETGTGAPPRSETPFSISTRPGR